MASDRPIRLAVLGLGFMGSTHVKALRDLPGVELVAVFSKDETKLSGDLTAVRGNIGTGGEKMDFATVSRYRDLDTLLNDSAIDAVDICLPTDLHVVVAVEAMRSGKHVLVEKPMALDGFAADRMISAASRSKRVLMAAQVLRFMAPYIALRQFAARDGMGPVRFAAFRRRCAAPGWSGWLNDPTLSGGGVFDLLIHDVDICLHLFGKPESVVASGYLDAARGIDCIDALLCYPHGGVVSITGGWHHPGAYPFCMEYTVTLEGGTVEYSSHGRPPVAYTPDGAETPLDGGARDGYTAEIGYFAECCRTGHDPELCPPRESAGAVKLMMLLLESRNRNGRKMLCRI